VLFVKVQVECMELSLGKGEEPTESMCIIIRGPVIQRDQYI